MGIENTTTETAIFANSSSSEPLTSMPTILIVFLTLQQFVFLVACAGNAFVIYVVLRYMSLRDNSNIFVLNLAIADFFTGIASGLQILFVFYPQLNVNVTTCILRYQMVGSMTLSSQITVFYLSVDRFMAICHQVYYEKFLTKTLSVVLMISPWLVSLSIGAATLLGWNRMTARTRCSYSMVFTPDYFWTIAITICTLSFFSFVAHFWIFIAIKRFYRRVNVMGNDMASEDRRLHKSIRGAKAMILLTIAFSICWLPYMTFPFAYANGYEKDVNLKNASSWLVFFGMLNSVVNPAIYAWYKKDFRAASKKVCSCCGFQQYGVSS